MAEGWIKLYRNIQEHWIWQDPQKLKWWLDILLLANHKENKFLLGNKLMKLERGEHHTSEVKLSDRWRVDRKTVRRFLELLESDGMIQLKKTPQGTTIKVSNYNDYQDFLDDKGTTERTTKSHLKGQHQGQQSPSQRDTNNNEKNDKNDKKNNYMSDSNEYRLAQYLYKHIKSNNPKAKRPNLQSWAKTFDYILRIDKRDIQEVKELIVFCQKHSFWYKNILSADKFRKQYDRLLLEKNDNKNPNYKNNKGDNFNNYDQRNYDFKELERKLLGVKEE